MDSTQLAHDDLVRRFEAELKWKDELEAKSVSILGFVGIFIAVLVSVPSLADEGGLPDLAPIVPALALQIVAACLLLSILYGYSVSIGPSIAGVSSAIREPTESVLPKLIGSYALSISNNRFQFTLRYSTYQMSIWIIVASLIQLVIGLSIDTLHIAERWLQLLTGALYWLPGLLMTVAGGAILYRDYRSLMDEHEDEFINLTDALTMKEPEIHG